MRNCQESKKVLMGKQLEVEAEVCIEDGTLVEKRKKGVVVWPLQKQRYGRSNEDFRGERSFEGWGNIRNRGIEDP